MYQRKRAGSHQLPRVFSSSFSLVQWVQQMGLIGLDVTPPLKRLFIRRALGHTADMPCLLIKKCHVFFNAKQNLNPAVRPRDSG